MATTIRDVNARAHGGGAIANMGAMIAPPRFVMFCLLLPAVAAALFPSLGLARATLAGFDAAATAFVVSIAPLLGRGEASAMRLQAKRNDANRTMLLAVTGAVTVTVLVAVGKVLHAGGDALGTALAIGALAASWLFSNVVYAMHYAHLYYGDANGDRTDDRGLDFPDCDEPDYWDFLYFGFTLGMTFQTSDVRITSRSLRKVALGHTAAAFVFNLGVVAFTINVLGGGS